MSEHIQMRQERRLPEYLLFKQSELYDFQQMITMSRKRIKFDGEISHGKFSAYTAYIEYEKGLYDEISCKNTLKKMDIINKLRKYLSQSIKDLYFKCTAKYPAYENLWIAALKDFQSYDLFQEIPNLVDAMKKALPKSQPLWIQIIDWAKNPQNPASTFETIHATFLEASKYCSNDYVIFKLHIKYILEMKNIQMKQRISTIKTIVVNQLEYLKSLEQYLNVLEMFDEYNNMLIIEDLLIESMLPIYSSSSKFWHEMAMRSLAGKFYKWNGNEIGTADQQLNINSNFNDNSCVRQHIPLKQRIDVCVHIYQIACQKLNNESMWHYYLTSMLTINKDTTQLINVKRYQLGKAFSLAKDENQISEELYVQYLLILLANTNLEYAEMVSKFEDAIYLYPYSRILWGMYFDYVIQCGDYEVITRKFQLGKFIPGSCSLWRKYYEYMLCLNTVPVDVMRTFLQDAIKQEDSDFDIFYKFLLAFEVQNSSLKYIEKTFELMMESTRPVPYIAFKEMIKILQCFGSIKKVRCCFNRAVDRIGSTNVDIWMDYIEYVYEANERNIVLRLYERAMLTLRPDLGAVFKEKYAEFMKYNNKYNKPISNDQEKQNGQKITKTGGSIVLD